MLGNDANKISFVISAIDSPCICRSRIRIGNTHLYGQREREPMAMSTRKRFYLSMVWMAAVILGGLAMLLSFVTHA